jgi:Microtubule associated protein 1A/1B, light chain 3.
MDYKSQCPDLKTRKEEFKKISFAHPNMIPLILEPVKNGVVLENNKFLVPKAYSFHEFTFNIRKRLKLSNSVALCFLVNDKHVPTLDKSMLAIYKEYKEPDGFLYIKYTIENTLG